MPWSSNSSRQASAIQRSRATFISAHTWDSPNVPVRPPLTRHDSTGIPDDQKPAGIVTERRAACWRTACYTASQPGWSGDVGGKLVLIVEDDPGNRAILQTLVEEIVGARSAL